MKIRGNGLVKAISIILIVLNVLAFFSAIFGLVVLPTLASNPEISVALEEYDLTLNDAFWGLIQGTIGSVIGLCAGIVGIMGSGTKRRNYLLVIGSVMLISWFIVDQSIAIYLAGLIPLNLVFNGVLPVLYCIGSVVAIVSARAVTKDN